MPDGHADRAQVAVKRDQAGAVIDQDGVAVDAKIFCKDDFAVVSCFDRVMVRDGEIEPDVVLPIDCLPVMNVRPPIGKIRLDLGVAQLQEGVVP